MTTEQLDTIMTIKRDLDMISLLVVNTNKLLDSVLLPEIGDSMSEFVRNTRHHEYMRKPVATVINGLVDNVRMDELAKVKHGFNVIKFAAEHGNVFDLDEYRLGRDSSWFTRVGILRLLTKLTQDKTFSKRRDGTYQLKTRGIQTVEAAAE